MSGKCECSSKRDKFHFLIEWKLSSVNLHNQPTYSWAGKINQAIREFHWLWDCTCTCYIERQRCKERDLENCWISAQCSVSFFCCHKRNKYLQWVIKWRCGRDNVSDCLRWEEVPLSKAGNMPKSFPDWDVNIGEMAFRFLLVLISVSHMFLASSFSSFLYL